MAALTAPRSLPLAGSTLRFHVHSSVEDMRLREIREPWTIAWLRAIPAQSVLYDIGANIGITALVAAEAGGSDIRVVAVEPFPPNFASLTRNIALNGLESRVIALPVGIGEKTGLRLFNWATLEPGGALHSFGPIIRPRSGEVIGPKGGHACACYRLDDLVRFEGMPFPTHLKIDVDGGEQDVLNGAENTLADNRLVAVQLEVTTLDAGRKGAIIAQFEAAGFALKAEFPHPSGTVVDLHFSRTR